MKMKSLPFLLAATVLLAAACTPLNTPHGNHSSDNDYRRPPAYGGHIH